MSKLFKRHRDKDTSYILTVRSKGEKVLFAFVFIIFALYALSLLFPFCWLIVNSLKHYTDYQLDVASGNPFALPKTLEWGNYAYSFSKLEDRGVTFPGMVWNSLWQCFLGLFLRLAVTSSVAYIVSRFKFMGRDLIYSVLIFVMTIPLIGSSASLFKLISDLHFYDTPVYTVVTSACVDGSSFLMFYAFFKNLPYGYAEAAYIDGAGEWTVFFKIMIPQALPLIFTLGIMSFMGVWNDYMTPLLFLPSFPNIASGMYRAKNTLMRTGRDTIAFAGMVITLIPSIVMFCCFSNVIMKNMTIGGLKG